jgi:hypothetical protein
LSHNSNNSNDINSINNNQDLLYNNSYNDDCNNSSLNNNIESVTHPTRTSDGDFALVSSFRHRHQLWQLSPSLSLPHRAQESVCERHTHAGVCERKLHTQESVCERDGTRRSV